MTATVSVLLRALVRTLNEIFDGPPQREGYLLNPGDVGVLRQLEGADAATASARTVLSKTTVAAHVRHVHYHLGAIRQIRAAMDKNHPERS